VPTALLAALLLALSTTGCAAAAVAVADGDGAPRPAPLAELDGTSWRLAAWSPEEPAAAQPQITLELAAHGISGSSGCNLYAAQIAETAPGAVEISALTSTDRPCFGPAAETDSRFTAALVSVHRLAFTGPDLLLTGETPEGMPVELRFVRDAD
jgi:heat shock protein HslJ